MEPQRWHCCGGQLVAGRLLPLKGALRACWGQLLRRSVALDGVGGQLGLLLPLLLLLTLASCACRTRQHEGRTGASCQGSRCWERLLVTQLLTPSQHQLVRGSGLLLAGGCTWRGWQGRQRWLASKGGGCLLAATARPRWSSQGWRSDAL